jgi:hypothetical protein
LSGGRNKFEDPISPFLPPAIPTWRTALESVDVNATRFVYPKVHPTDLGYVFPEPASFLSIQSLDRQKGFFQTWLRYRHALIYCVSCGGFDAQPMPNTVWCTLLSHKFVARGNAAKAGTRSQKMHEMTKDFLQSCLDAEGVEIGDSDGFNAPVTWSGKTFKSLGREEYEGIIWELVELNFRFELLALNACATIDSPSSRQGLVSVCFPRPSSGASLLIADLNGANQGLASLLWADRHDYVLALRRVMLSWNGELPPIIRMDKVQWDTEEAMELENVITRHYCKTFYNYFQRAPIVPRRLSHTVGVYQRPTPTITIQDPRLNITYDTSVLSKI